jgi:hypothetical protein
MTSLEGLDRWEALSRCHPGVRLGLECFESFEDELLSVLIENGSVTEMDRHGVLPDEWGSFHDEDGEPLDDGLLRAAAESVAAQRLSHDVGTLSGGLDVAVTMAQALGRACQRIEPTMFDEPRRDSLDAVIELAVFALRISTSATSMGPAESEFEHALQLTRSMVHAGRSELRDEPGKASWSEWLQIIIGSASDVIDTACHCWFEAETEGHAIGAEHFGTPPEQLELAARSLLTTCLQTLALFNGKTGEGRYTNSCVS